MSAVQPEQRRIYLDAVDWQPSPGWRVFLDEHSRGESEVEFRDAQGIALVRVPLEPHGDWIHGPKYQWSEVRLVRGPTDPVLATVPGIYTQPPDLTAYVCRVIGRWVFAVEPQHWPCDQQTWSQRQPGTPENTSRLLLLNRYNIGTVGDNSFPIEGGPTPRYVRQTTSAHAVSYAALAAKIWNDAKLVQAEGLPEPRHNEQGPPADPDGPSTQYLPRIAVTYAGKRNEGDLVMDQSNQPVGIWVHTSKQFIRCLPEEKPPTL